MVNDLEKTKRPKNKQLVYTSLASGEFLLDYLLIKALRRAGYNNIDINVIDLLIGNKKTIEQKIKLAKNESETRDFIHYEHDLDSLLNQVFRQEAFKNKIGGNFMWTKETIKDKPLVKDTPGIYITPWDNVNTYLSFVKKNPKFKTDILILTDPSIGVGIVDNKDDANGLLLVKTNVPPLSKEFEIQKMNLDFNIKVDLEGSQQDHQEKNEEKSEDDLFETFKKPSTYIIFSPSRGAEVFDNQGKTYTFVWTSDIYVLFMDLVKNASQDNVLLYILDFIENKDEMGIYHMTRSEYLQRPSISPRFREDLVIDYDFRSSKQLDTSRKPPSISSFSSLKL